MINLYGIKIFDDLDMSSVVKPKNNWWLAVMNKEKNYLIWHLMTSYTEILLYYWDIKQIFIIAIWSFSSTLVVKKLFQFTPLSYNSLYCNIRLLGQLFVCAWIARKNREKRHFLHAVIYSDIACFMQQQLTLGRQTWDKMIILVLLLSPISEALKQSNWKPVIFTLNWWQIPLHPGAVFSF